MALANWEPEPLVLLRWESESSTYQYYEPDGYVYETAGDIHVLNDADEPQLAGKFRTYYLDVDGAVDDDEPLFEVLDAHSSTALAYYDPLFSPDTDMFNEQVLELIGHEMAGGNLLILDRLELLPQFRGNRLGLGIMRHMIRRFSPGSGIIALKPFPLQFEACHSKDREQGWRAELALNSAAKKIKKLQHRSYRSTTAESDLCLCRTFR